MKRSGFSLIVAGMVVFFLLAIAALGLGMAAVVVEANKPLDATTQALIASEDEATSIDHHELASANSSPTTETLAKYAIQIQPLLELDYTEENRKQLLNTVAQILGDYPPTSAGTSTRVDIPISIPLEPEPGTLHHHINPWANRYVLGTPYIGETDFVRYRNEDEYFIVYLVIDPTSASLVTGRSESLGFVPNSSTYANWVTGFANRLPFLLPDPGLISQT